MAENPSQDSMMRMQQEALRRVRNMQERARNSVQNEPETRGREDVAEHKETQNRSNPPKEEYERKAPVPEEKAAMSSHRDPGPGLLSLLSGGNSESMLLLVLLLLLADEKADPALLMAVLYLIL